MLKSVRMEKLAIIGPKNEMEDTIEKLYDLGCLHVSDVTKKLTDEEWQTLLKASAPLETSESISAMLLKIRGMLTALPRPDGLAAGRPKGKATFEELQNTYAKLLKKAEGPILEKMDAIDALEAQEKDVNDRIKLLSPLQSVPIRLATLQGYSSIAVSVGAVPSNKIDTLKKQSVFDEAFFYTSDSETIAVLFSQNGRAAEAAQALRDAEFREIPLPDATETASEEILLADKKLQTLAEQKNAIQTELKTLADEHYAPLYELYLRLERASIKAETPLKFGSGTNYFAAFGWVPKSDVETVKNAFSAEGGIHIDVIGHDEEPPVKLENPDVAKPFEGITELMALPKYHEIDPSSIMLITFPLFFGLMLGDIAYGFIIYFFIRWGGMQKLCNFIGLGNIPPEARLSKILMYCALSSVAFGVFFGEFFGFELFGHHSIIGLHDIHTFNRLESVVPLLVASMTIGAAHIILGYALGFINERAEGKSMKEAMGKLGWIVASVGFYLIVLGLFNFVELGTAGMVGAALIVAGLVVILRSEGALAAVEITMPLSNLFSYARLMAFGLSSIAIATVANKMLEMGGDGLSGGTIIAIIGAVLLHVLNTLLALLPMFLQSLRLHYVEFFIKFYEGGGESYNPLGGNDKWNQ